MFDADTGVGRYDGFGVISDTQTRTHQHRQIVGPVADSNRIINGNRVLGAQGIQDFQLGVLVDNGVYNLAG